MRLSSLGLRPQVGPLYQPQVVDRSIQHWRNDNLQGKPKVRKKNIPQCHFFHLKSCIDDTGIEAVSPRWEASG
jgi:hypothetical protein